MGRTCDVNWGSHGCELPRGHDGYCYCDCARPDDDDPNPVGAYPYYGPETLFYGQDVQVVWAVGEDRPLSESPRFGNVDAPIRDVAIAVLAEMLTAQEADSRDPLTPERARAWAEDLWDRRAEP